MTYENQVFGNNITQNSLESGNVDPNISQKVNWEGREVKQLSPAFGDDRNSNSGRGGIGCCGLGILLLIVGGIMYAVAKKQCDDPTRECNQSLLDAGEITMITGGTVMGISCFCCCLILCCAGGLAVHMRNNRNREIIDAFNNINHRRRAERRDDHDEGDNGRSPVSNLGDKTEVS